MVGFSVSCIVMSGMRRSAIGFAHDRDGVVSLRCCACTVHSFGCATTTRIILALAKVRLQQASLEPRR
eukprot:9502129-Pyramimonas_sp.AAC.1